MSNNQQQPGPYAMSAVPAIPLPIRFRACPTGGLIRSTVPSRCGHEIYVFPVASKNVWMRIGSYAGRTIPFRVNIPNLTVGEFKERLRDEDLGVSVHLQLNSWTLNRDGQPDPQTLMQHVICGDDRPVLDQFLQAGRDYELVVRYGRDIRG